MEAAAMSCILLYLYLKAVPGPTRFKSGLGSTPNQIFALAPSLLSTMKKLVTCANASAVFKATLPEPSHAVKA